MQVLANGVIAGLAVAVFALAFQLVYLPTRIFYFAIAAVFAVAPFPAWQMVQWGVPLVVAVPAAVAVAALLSCMMERLTHGPMAARDSSLTSQFIASLGYNIVIIQGLAIIWGNDPKVLPSPQGTVEFAGIILTQSRMLLFCASLAILGGFFLWLHRSSVGLEFRALADNTRELAVRGHDIRRLRLTAFTISGAMAGLISVLMALEQGFYSYSGLPMFLLAVVAAIIGGRLSFLGAVLGGVLLGIIRAQVEWYLSPAWLNALTFAALVLFLLFRPQGIIAKTRRIESEG